MDNNVTKYHQYPSRHSKVMDRTRFAKRIPEPLPNGRNKRMFNIPETESVAIESKFGDWKTFKN
jgi:hypothetical protein